MGDPDLPDKVSRLIAVAALCACASCGWFPLPEKPRFSLTAVGGYLELEGRGRMQSPVAGGGKVDNPYIDLGSELNTSDREFAIGATAAYGDGFQGGELHFLRWEESEVKTLGTMRHDFGILRNGDSIHSEVLLNQLRLDYIAQLWEHDFEPVTVRMGLGAGLHHNQVRLASETQNATPVRQQTIKFHDNGMLLLRGRAELEWRPFKVRVDGGWTEGDWGGIEGRVLDLAATVHYRVQRDVSAYFGYSRYDLPGAGLQSGLAYDFDMDLQGWIFGVRFEF